nr:HAMP domain-containing sensor histidine kinase [Streptomyces sporangiiformans]
MVEVADTGPGIPAGRPPYAFDRLWRGPRARARSGIGIGLAVVKELITAHGGTVSADSGPGGGTRMNPRLPRAESQGSRLIPAPGTEPRVA